MTNGDICPRCKEIKASDKYKHCEACRAYWVERKRRRVTPDGPDICSRCKKKKPVDGFKMCPACRAYWAKRRPAGTNIPNADEYEALQESGDGGDHYELDAWYEVCLSCPLPECVRLEGEIQVVPRASWERLKDCPICQIVS